MADFAEAVVVVAEEIRSVLMLHALPVGMLGAWIVGEQPLPCTPAAYVAEEEEGRDIDMRAVAGGVVEAEAAADAAASQEAFEGHGDCKPVDLAHM